MWSGFQVAGDQLTEAEADPAQTAQHDEGKDKRTFCNGLKFNCTVIL